MPYRIIIAVQHQSLIQMICGVLRLLSLSCIVTLTTTATDQMTELVHDLEPHLLILGFSRKNAGAAIRVRACVCCGWGSRRSRCPKPMSPSVAL